MSVLSRSLQAVLVVSQRRQTDTKSSPFTSSASLSSKYTNRHTPDTSLDGTPPLWCGCQYLYYYYQQYALQTNHHQPHYDEIRPAQCVSTNTLLPPTLLTGHVQQKACYHLCCPTRKTLACKRLFFLLGQSQTPPFHRF